MSDYREEVTKCLLAIKNDDQTQFERLTKLTHAPLLTVAKRYLLNDSYCEDVVSEVYYNITRYAASFRPTDKLDGYRYLWTIVRNNAFDINKDILKHQTVSIDNVYPFDTTDTTDQFERANLKMDISSAIQQLDSKDTMIILWRYKYDFTLDQIADLLDVSTSAVSQRLSKARGKLKNLLQK